MAIRPTILANYLSYTGTFASKSLPLCRWSSSLTINPSPDGRATNHRALKTRRNEEFDRRRKREQEMEERAKSLERNQTRDWKSGDVYSPHDLSPSEMKKWRKRRSPSSDAFDALALNPLHQYKNFAIMSEYMTEMGRIKHSSETGLRPANQRKMAKAIRRAVALGLMPSVHRHPEILLEENTL